MKNFIISFSQYWAYYMLIVVLGIIRKSRKFKMRFLDSRCLFMDSCASKLDSGAISSQGAIGSLESAPKGSITGPIVGHWGQRFFSFTLLLKNNFLFIYTKMKFPGYMKLYLMWYYCKWCLLVQLLKITVKAKLKTFSCPNSSMSLVHIIFHVFLLKKIQLRTTSRQ